MDKIVAYCGLICNDCEAFQATQAKDVEAQERVAAKWREEYQAPNTTAASILCDGCTTPSAVKCGHCGECDMRLCGAERGVANCGECPDYERCERIQNFFKYVPSAKLILDEIHTGRAAV